MLKKHNNIYISIDDAREKCTPTKPVHSQRAQEKETYILLSCVKYTGMLFWSRQQKRNSRRKDKSLPGFDEAT